MADKASDMSASMLDQWAVGDLDLSVEHEARGAFNTFRLIERLLGPDQPDGSTFAEIAAFYQDIDAEEHDAAEDNRNSEDQD